MANDTVAIRQHHLNVSRVFAAPREQVFAAWSSAEHVKLWFCPRMFTVPDAKVEFRVGGAFEVCMRAPDGSDHWTRGHFTEIIPNTRLALEMGVADADGDMLFTASTVVDFENDCGGTRMSVEQHYLLLQPAAEMMVKGAQQGWAETLDNLGRALSYQAEQSAAARNIVHGSFRIERHFNAPRERVWQAFADRAAKDKWFSGGKGYTSIKREMDVRPGGREIAQGRWDSGMVSSFDAVYFDVLPNERLVYSYEMHLDERKISVSLATIELRGDGATTTVVVNEHGAFLDGYDDAGSRERGTRSLLDAIAASLEH
ncbi:hypothetical protein GCM10027321_19640 [Massilia terrae]|uniref:SRPBCC family protein n=1 Tax=Massilia terrae TaxID=1811224 RepID=A0ABT2CWR4_9BURK|nr:SRPBCC family protein [Massilia terrae]MCS0658425.1 SRPBCC family protein [Massilia terrae]